MFNFVEIHDIISQRKHHGFHVPDYLLEKEDFIAEQAMELLMKSLGNDVAELRTSIGALVELICSEIETASTGDSECKKFLLYGNHDTTILCLQKVLGTFNGQWPGYVSSIIIELYVSDDNASSPEYFVRVLSDKEPVCLVEGEEYLPLNKFLSLLEQYRVTDWNSECGNENTSHGKVI